MSKAVELEKTLVEVLADKFDLIPCKHATFAGGLGFALCPEELEAFYHAARAEALREAAEKACGLCSPELFRMADREGQ